MTNAEKILSFAKADIGYKQGADRKNKFGAWYAEQSKTPGMNGQPWCVMAVQYWYNAAGLKLPYLSASCSQLLGWYKANQPECVIPLAQASPGCLVIFDLPNTGVVTDHMGLLESMSADYVTTIDGNTSGANDANGGCVNRRMRAKKYVYAVIRPRELSASDIPTGSAASKVDMSGKEIYLALTDYLMKQSLPEDMKEEYGRAVVNGITDGMNPCLLTPRWQAAIMAYRACKKALHNMKD